MQENVADIMAWLAIIAANVAITKTGQNKPSACSQHSNTSIFVNKDLSLHENYLKLLAGVFQHE